MKRRGNACGCYFRVSTEDQKLENQVPEVLAFCKQRELDVVERYQEKVSGRNTRRPEYDRMLEAAHGRQFETIVVWSLDRFGRNSLRVMQDLLALEEANVHVLSVKEPWLDTAGPMRRVLLHFASFVAELEVQNLSTRTRTGIERARAEGIRIGRPRTTSSGLAKALVDVRAGVPKVRAAKENSISLTTLKRRLRETA